MRRSYFAAKTLFFGTVLALSMSFAPAQGAFIATESTTVTQLSSSSYLYSYTVTVAANSTVSASEFDLSLGAAIDPNSIINPSNFFAFYTLGDPFITFTAFDNGTLFSGISPGSSGTFSFTSAFAPVLGSFQLVGLDPSFTTAVITGSALMPGAVPEPSSLLLLGVGFCGALGFLARSRPRSKVSVG